MLKQKELKLIPSSKRGYPIIFINKAKVHVFNETLVYSANEDSLEITNNIPYLNTSILILGFGTSISNEAAILLGKSKTLVFFTNKKYDLYSLLIPEESLLTNKYNLKHIENLFKLDKRLELAKLLFKTRLEFNELFLHKLFNSSLYLNNLDLFKLDNYLNANSIEEMLGFEGSYMKKFYNLLLNDFTHINQDLIKERLKIANHLCYALSSIVLTSLGINFSLSILHGRTNNGSLRYDIADIIKGISIYLAVLSLDKNSDFYTEKESDFYKTVISFLTDNSILELLFDLTIKGLDLKNA